MIDAASSARTVRTVDTAAVTGDPVAEATQQNRQGAVELVAVAAAAGEGDPGRRVVRIDAPSLPGLDPERLVRDPFGMPSVQPQGRSPALLWPALPSRVEGNFRRLLELAAGRKATCFFLGWIAERHPDMVRRCLGAGHEIASPPRRPTPRRGVPRSGREVRPGRRPPTRSGPAGSRLQDNRRRRGRTHGRRYHRGRRCDQGQRCSDGTS